MELMKLKDAAIVDLLDAETLGGWINVLPSSRLSCTEIHMSRSTINIHERAEFNQPSSSSNTASLYLQSHCEHLSAASPLRFFTPLRWVTGTDSWPDQVSTFLLTMPYKHLNSAPGLHTTQKWPELHPLLGWASLFVQGHLIQSPSHQLCAQRCTARCASPGSETRCAQFTHIRASSAVWLTTK